MAVPAPEVPPGNSYSVHVGGVRPKHPAEARPGAMAWIAAAIGAQARPRKVDVRAHLVGDDGITRGFRDFLLASGVKSSAFSPAPDPSLPGEGFWKTTLAVIPGAPEESPGNLLVPSRDGRKVEWDCLLVAVAETLPPEAFSAAQIALPDLWVVTGQDAGVVARTWRDAGAGAVAALDATQAAWISASASFGNSTGRRERTGPPPVEASSQGVPPALPFAFFTAGIVDGLLDELLGESLFSKTMVRVERDCLEARPLRMARACASGLAAEAALRGAVPDVGPEAVVHKHGELTGRMRGNLARLRGPAGQPWAHKGR